MLSAVDVEVVSTMTIRAAASARYTRHTSPNTAVGTEPSSRTSRGLPLTSPSPVPTTMPRSTRTPIASTFRCRITPVRMPSAGKAPLRMSADTWLCPAERSTE